MLDTARTLIVKEIAIAREKTEDKVQAEIDRSSTPTDPLPPLHAPPRRVARPRSSSAGARARPAAARVRRPRLQARHPAPLRVHPPKYPPDPTARCPRDGRASSTARQILGRVSPRTPSRVSSGPGGRQAATWWSTGHRAAAQTAATPSRTDPLAFLARSLPHRAGDRPRRMASKTLVINVDIGETRVALIEDGSVTELYMEREQDEPRRKRLSRQGHARAARHAGRVRRHRPRSRGLPPRRRRRPRRGHGRAPGAEEEATRRRRRRRGRGRRGRGAPRAQAQDARVTRRRRSATCSKRAELSCRSPRADRHQGRARHQPRLAAGPLRACTCRRSSTSASPSASATRTSASACAKSIEAFKPPKGGLIVRTVARADQEAAQGRRRLPRQALGGHPRKKREGRQGARRCSTPSSTWCCARRAT